MTSSSATISGSCTVPAAAGLDDCAVSDGRPNIALLSWFRVRLRPGDARREWLEGFPSWHAKSVHVSATVGESGVWPTKLLPTVAGILLR
jgi:hypothetical protein